MSDINNNKRIAKNTMMLYIRMLFSMVVSLYTSRVVLNTLGVEDYGIYGVVGGVVVLFSFLNNAMSVATQRFLNFELGRQDMFRVKCVFNVSITIYIFIALLIILLSETIGIWFFYTKLNIPFDRQNAAMWVYQMSVLASCLSVIRIPYNALVIAYEKMSFFAYVSIIEVLLKLLIVIVLVHIAFDHLIMYSILLFIVSFVVVVVYVLYCNLNFSVSKYSFCWDKELFGKLTSYSAWNMFGASAGVAKDQGINFLLNIFFTPSINAAHAISMQINSAIFQFYNSILVAAQPQIIKYYAAQELEKMYRLVFLVVKIIYLLLIVISLPLFFDTSFILNLWLGTVPGYSVPFIRILIGITCVDAMATPLMTVAHATGKIKLYQSLVGTITICIIPVSYLFLRYGGLEPTIVYVISLCLSIVNFFIRLWFVNDLAKFPVYDFLSQVMFRVIIMTIILVLFMYLMGNLFICDSVFIFVVKLVISSALSLFLFYCLCFNSREKNMFINKIQSCFKQYVKF